MQIGNFKSIADRDAKLKAQAEYLKLMIDNQSILEQRVKDYKNPNKPPPVPPQYKTYAELEKDSIKQEKDAKDNLATLGDLDFNTIMSVVTDLRTRGEGYLVKFNRNFPIIKKQIQEELNPKLLNSEVLLTKIDQIFNKIDSTFGLNQGDYRTENIFSRNPTDIQEIIPSSELLENTLEIVNNALDFITQNLEIEQAYDETKIKSIMIIIQKLVNTLPTQAELDSINKLPAIERDDLLKILSKLVKAGIIPTKQNIQKITGAIGEQAVQLDLENAHQEGIFDEELTDNLADAGDYDTAEFQSNPRTDALRVQLLNKQLQDIFILGNLLNTITDGTFTFLQEFKNKYNKIFGQALEESKKFAIEDYEKTLNVVNPKIREEIKGLNIQQAKYRLKTINNKVNTLTDFIRREISLKPLKERRRRIIEALLEEQKRYEEMDALREHLILEARDVEEQIRLTEQQKEEERQQLLLEQEVSRLIPDFEDIIFELEQEHAYENKNFGVLESGEEEEFNRVNPRQETLRELYETSLERSQERNPQRVPNIEQTRENQRKIDAVETYLMRKFADFSQASLAKILENNQYRNYSKQSLELVKSPESKAVLIETLVKNILNEQLDNIISGRYNPEQDLGTRQETPPTQGIKQFGFGVKKFHAKKIKIGRGLTIIEEKPRYREFGKNRIHNKLLDENVIHIKYPSLANIPSLKPVEVSSNYRDLIIGLLDTGRVDNKKLSTLSSKEDEHFRKIIKASGLSEQLEIHPKRDDQEEKDYNRLVLLKGEYEAGNNNEKMIKELRALVVKFISLGRIPRKTGLNFLMQISI